MKLRFINSRFREGLYILCEALPNQESLAISVSWSLALQMWAFGKRSSTLIELAYSSLIPVFIAAGAMYILAQLCPNINKAHIGYCIEIETFYVLNLLFTRHYL